MKVVKRLPLDYDTLVARRSYPMERNRSPVFVSCQAWVGAVLVAVAFSLLSH